MCREQKILENSALNGTSMSHVSPQGSERCGRIVRARWCLPEAGFSRHSRTVAHMNSRLL